MTKEKFNNFVVKSYFIYVVITLIMLVIFLNHYFESITLGIFIAWTILTAIEIILTMIGVLWRF